MPRQRRPRTPAQQRATAKMLAANRQRRARVGRTGRQRRPSPSSPRRPRRRTIRLSPQQARAYRSGRIIRPRMAEWDKPVRW